MKRQPIDAHFLIEELIKQLAPFSVPEAKVREIVVSVLKRQPRQHNDMCSTDKYTQDVCEGTYADKLEDVLQLSEALRGVRTLAGESPEIAKIVDTVLEQHGL